MNLLIIYVGTSLLSIIIREINNLVIQYDLSKYGLRLDEEMLDNNPNVQLFNLQKIGLWHICPIVNLLKAFNCLKKYLEDPEKSLKLLENNEFLSEMYLFEKIEYLQKPTLLNLLKIYSKSKHRLNKSLFIESYDENKKVNGEVLYEYNPDNQEITILETYGIFDNMLTSEIKEIILERGMKSLPKKSVKEKMEDVKNYIIRSVCVEKFRSLKGKFFALKKGDDIPNDDKLMVINLNEKDTGFSQIVAEETLPGKYEVISIVGGIRALPQYEMETAVYLAVREYLKKWKNVESDDISINEDGNAKSLCKKYYS